MILMKKMYQKNLKKEILDQMMLIHIQIKFNNSIFEINIDSILTSIQIPSNIIVFSFDKKEKKYELFDFTTIPSKTENQEV
jgi:hypothetical protein